MPGNKAEKIVVARRRLVLAPRPDIHPGKDIVAGPWCFRSKNYEDRWHRQKWEPDPFPSTESLVAAERTTLAAALMLLEQLVPELNRRNATCHGAIFWDILLMPWLLTFVHVVYEREQRVRDIIEKYREVPLEVELIDGPARWDFTDTDEFFERGVFADVFNHWLFSEIIKSDPPPAWALRLESASAGVKAVRRPTTLRAAVKKKTASLRFAPIYGTSFAERLLFSLALTLKPAVEPAPHALAEHQGALPEWRCDIIKLALASMPRCFDSLTQWAPRRVATRAGKVSVNNGYNFSEPQKYCAALRAEAGEHLLDGQHGGNYGNMRVSPMHYAAEYRRGPFLSWGWARQGAYPVNCIPLPSPHLSGMRRAEVCTGEIILVGAYQNAYCYRIMSATQPGQQASYVADKLAFINTLATPVRARLAYRPYPDSAGDFGDAAFIRAHAPDLPICRGEFRSRLMQAGLVVLDHPGTTMNICIAAEIPLVCFWDSHVWAMCDDSQPLFEGLRRAGILHDDGRTAARHINAVADAIPQWWNDPATVKARSAWGNAYARTSKSWRREWMKTLLRYDGGMP